MAGVAVTVPSDHKQPGMSTIAVTAKFELSKAGAVPLVFAPAPRDRSFWAGLVAALLVHSLVFLGLATHVPRGVGNPNGSADAINVDLVDDADLQRSSGGSSPGAEAPSADTPAEQAQAMSPPTPATPPVEPAPENQKPVDKPQPERVADKTQPENELTGKEPAEKELAEPAPLPKSPPPPQKTKPPPKPAELKLKSALPADDLDLSDLLSLKPSPPQKMASAEPVNPRPPQKTEAAKPSAKPAAPARPKVDLSLPSAGASFSESFSGKSAGFARPEGITRSGENDEFARGVIRALRQTMPEGRGTRSRLTVRITLSEIGNLAEVRLIHASIDPTLDQNVMFAIKQSNFPIPPGSLKPIDRIFLVTYVYN